MTVHEHDEVIIDRGGGGNSGIGMILGVILVLVVVGLIVWFAMFNKPTSQTNINVNGGGAPVPSLKLPASS
jgi:hypothetical protein